MSAPTIIAGPAIVQFNSQSYYTEGDVVVTLARETFAVTSALAGRIDERLVAQAVEISFRPVGALDATAKYLPYALTQIGSLLINQASLKTVVVWGKDGVKTTWANGFISALPSFTLAPTKSAIGSDMTITCFGDPAKAQTDADAWNAITSAALSDTTFDETKLVTPQWTAAWGASPFDALEAEDGFTFEVAMSMRAIKLANYGNVNAMLTDLVGRVRFVPANLTEAQIWTMMNLQGSGAIVPGASVASATDLVITAGGRSFTLHDAGPTSARVQYGLTALRQGEVAFVSRKTWTTGAVNSLITLDWSA